MADQRRPLAVAFTVHSARAAATRLRVVQYREALAAAGVDLALWTLLAERDEDRWLRSPLWRRAALVSWRALTRTPSLVRLARRAAVVIVQREVLPFGPPVVERALGRRRPLIWDIDDAAWAHHTSVPGLPRWLRAPGGKYARLCRMADEVWAGSDVLARWCRDRNPEVHVIPTVVDVPAAPPEGDRHLVAWIGTPTTGTFLEQVLPALTKVVPRPRVRVVGATPAVSAGLDAEIVPWSPEVESATLAAARVGLYPIERSHPLAEGKCGLKAILYMAHGVPPVVTPTPTNAAIVRDGVDGLHAETEEEWASAVQRLLVDDGLWRRLSESGHQRVRTDFALAVWGPLVAGRLRARAGGGAAR